MSQNLTAPGAVALREVIDNDLPVFFEQRLEEVANSMCRQPHGLDI